jgi:inosine-uridine nucleoside N-ribohydrolase
MPSTFPTTLDSWPTDRADGTAKATTHKDDHNNANDAINKIEQQLLPLLNYIGIPGRTVYVSTTAPSAASPGDLWLFQPPTTPKRVIFSTDWWTDVDDAVALRLLLHAERLGLVDIRACVISTLLAKGPGSLDALCHFEGRTRMPIGMDPVYAPGGVPPYQTTLFDNNWHDAGYSTATLSSVEVMRRALAEAPNASVDIIEVGYHTNLQKLLQSTSDAISSLTGLQLVTDKVKRLWVMGGEYPTEGLTSNNFARDATAMAAANYVFANWPGEIYLQGDTIGNEIRTGENLQGTTATDPLAQALSDHGSLTTGRNSWDPLCTWAACLDDIFTSCYSLVRGTNAVNSGTGVNTFTANPASGNHYYMKKTAPDYWYKKDLNRRLVPFSLYPPALPPALDGVEVRMFDQGVEKRTQVALPARTTGSLATGLIMHLHADDLTSIGTGNTVSHWEDRMRRNHVRQLTSANRPTFRTGIGALNAVEFTGGNVMFVSDWLDEEFGPFYTVFAKIRFATLPTSTQDIVSADTNYSEYRRIFHLAAFLSANPFTPNSFNTSATNMVINTWYNAALRVKFSSPNHVLDGYKDGTASTPQTMNNANRIAVTSQIAIGNRYANAPGTEPFVGYIREVRAYNYALSDADVASVIAAM